MAVPREHSITRKLTRMNMLVSAAALLLACVAFTGYDWVTFRANAVHNLSAQAQVIGSNSVSALVFDDPQSAQNTLSSLSNSPHVICARIYTSDGKPFASYVREGASLPTESLAIARGQSETSRFQGGSIVLAHSIVFQDQRTGTIYIQADLDDLWARLERYAAIAAVVWIVSLLAALLVSRIFRKEIARPIVNLAQIARIVSQEKNYSVRAQLAADSGEIAILIEAFNQMLSQIEQRDEDLRHAHDELEDRVQERTTQLAAANSELEAFSYSVSHDLRAPLRTIDGFSLAVVEDYGDKLDAAGQQQLQRIRTATQRMSMLIDDLLNLSRVTRSQMRRESLDLSTMARSVANELHETDPSRKVEFVIADNLAVLGDSRLLRVVMENLLGNAWKYTSRHERARVEFGYQQTAEGWAYFVRDDGAGFDQSYSSRLFGAFQRLHTVEEFSGIGVGLATVQRIVRRHGGTIWATGEVEKGATFYFTLGAKAPDESASHEQEQSVAHPTLA